MDQHVMVVVGDSFAAFARRPQVRTLSDFGQWLESDAPRTGREHVIIGQGIGLEARAALQRLLDLSGIPHITHAGALAPLALTHKRSMDAVLITEPRHTGARRLEFGLVIDDAQDRLSDHVTGQHLGAMLLMEAARQATIAGIECEWIAGRALPQGFILKTFNAQFDNYAFPLPATLRVAMTEEACSATQVDVALDIEFVQGGKSVSHMHLDVRLLQADVLERIESRRADQALAAVLRMQSAAPSAVAA
jgi:hypothetical protein